MIRRKTVGSLLGLALCLALPLGLLAGDEHGKLETHWSHVMDEVRGGSFLGVYLKEVKSENLKDMKLDRERGALVTGTLEDTPARKAGIKKGDVILAFNDTSLESAMQLRRMLKETPGGRTVEFTVWRNGSKKKIPVTLEAKPSLFQDGAVYFDPQHRDKWQEVWDQLGEDGEVVMEELGEVFRELHQEFEANGGDEFLQELIEGLENQNFEFHFDTDKMKVRGKKPRLGVHLQDLNPQLAEFFGVERGLLISEVVEDSPADKAGLKAGDVIVRAGDHEVGNSSDLVGVILGHAGGDLEVTVVREGQERSFTARIPEVKSKTT